MCYYLLLAENRNSQLVVTPCASHQQCHKPTLRSHLSLMGFHLLRSMSATLVAFLMVMCATPAGCSDPDPYGLVFNRNPLSWADAEAYCVSIGGHLASVSSEAMARHIDDNYVRGGACHATWIGYNDRATEGDWVWTGAASSYTNWWQPTEPNDMNPGEDCALLGVDCIFWTHFMVGNRWTDYGCSSAQASVCQMPPTPPPPPSPPSPPFPPPSPRPPPSSPPPPSPPPSSPPPPSPPPDTDVFIIFAVVPLAVALIGTLGGVYGCYRSKCCCVQGRREPPRPTTQSSLALPGVVLPVIPLAQPIMVPQAQVVAKVV